MEAKITTEVQSVHRALGLLQCFTRQRPQYGLSELAQAVGLPVSTVARLVKTLESLGYLERIAGTAQYRLGMVLYYLGKVVEQRMSVRELAQPLLAQLSRESGESADLFIRRGDTRVCIAQTHGNHTVRHYIPLGERLPLWAGSAGALFLAYTDDADVDRVLSEAHALTNRTLLDRQAWEQRRVEVRRIGYAASFEERELGVASLSAPVFDSEGKLAACVGISAPALRLSGERLATHVALVTSAASQLSQLLGYRPGPAKEES